MTLEFSFISGRLGNCAAIETTTNWYIVILHSELRYFIHYVSFPGFLPRFDKESFGRCN